MSRVSASLKYPSARPRLTELHRIFAPTKQPRLAISYRNEVEVDYGGLIQLTTVDDYRRSVREPTWRAVQKFIHEAVERKLRIVFFSATPQGGGVALMRHALLRFLQMQGVNVEWLVPLLVLQKVYSLLNTSNQVCPETETGRLSGHQDEPQHPPGRGAPRGTSN